MTIFPHSTSAKRFAVSVSDKNQRFFPPNWLCSLHIRKKLTGSRETLPPLQEMYQGCPRSNSTTPVQEMYSVAICPLTPSLMLTVFRLEKSGTSSAMRAPAILPLEHLRTAYIQRLPTKSCTQEKNSVNKRCHCHQTLPRGYLETAALAPN